MKSHLVHLIVAAGAVILLLSFLADGPHTSVFERVGMLAVLLGYIEIRISRIPNKTALYQLGDQDGYRRGYDEGRRANMTVVPMPRPCQAPCCAKAREQAEAL